MPSPTQCHLQVHPHFGSQQSLRERQRCGIRQPEIAADMDRGPNIAPPRFFRFETDGKIDAVVGWRRKIPI